jgi:hypothetical protein
VLNPPLIGMLFLNLSTKFQSKADDFYNMRYMRLFAVVKMSVVVFWVVVPCELVSGYQYFRGTYCCYLPGSITLLLLNNEVKNPS